MDRREKDGHESPVESTEEDIEAKGSKRTLVYQNSLSPLERDKQQLMSSVKGSIILQVKKQSDLN